METKTLLQSKTFWFNVVTGLLGILTALNSETLTKLGVDGAAQERVLFGIGTVVTIGNIYLRTISTASVTVK